jgi:hypothetical protein
MLRRFAPHLKNVDHKVVLIAGVYIAAASSDMVQLCVIILHDTFSREALRDAHHVLDVDAKKGHVCMPQMEVVHYNKGANAVGELICDHAKDLLAAAVVLARCAVAG